MSRIAFFVALLASLVGANAFAAKQLIIDVEAENRPRVPRNPGSKAPGDKPAPPPVKAEVLLRLSENDTARNLSQGLVDSLTAMGYVVAPEVEFGLPKKPKAPPRPDPKAPPKPPDPKNVLKIEIVRMSGSCFITGRAFEFATQDIAFFKYETTDDTLPCTDQLKLCLAEFFKSRPPEKLPPGPDAGVAGAEGAALAAKHPTLVLAPTLIKTDDHEPVDLGPADAPDAAPAPAPEPAKKKGCGCGSAGDGLLLAALAAVLAPLARRRG